VICRNQSKGLLDGGGIAPLDQEFVPDMGIIIAALLVGNARRPQGGRQKEILLAGVQMLVNRGFMGQIHLQRLAQAGRRRQRGSGQHASC